MLSAPGDPSGPLRPDLIGRLLSLPREAGTPQAAAARDLVTRHLQQLGYQVEAQQFSFTPASLRAFPLFGAGLGGLALLLLPFLNSVTAPAWGALTVWVAGLLALLVIAGGVGLGWVTLGEPRRQDANLIAIRGETPPRRWIVAHLDTKAQRHSMAGRLVAVWMISLAVILLTALGVARLFGPLAPGWLAAGAGLALLGGVFASKGRLSGRSLGARDNGTGVIAALHAAEAASDPRIGILITGAEEFGLVGARVFAQRTPGIQEMEFVNLDTLDDQGRLYVVSHDARGERLADTLEPKLSRLNLSLRRRRLPLGVFVDSAPLARAGASAITIGRLTWSTLRRIHTLSDTPDNLSLVSAQQIGKALVSN
jgi:Peptidase family M28